MNILLIHRDVTTQQVFSLYLAAEGHHCFATDSCEECIAAANAVEYDLIIMGETFDDGSPLVVIDSLRKRKVWLPVMVLLERDESTDARLHNTVQYLKAGADDCLQAPVSKKELMARVVSIVRRYRGFAHSLISLGGVSIDLDKHRLYVNGSPVHVSMRPYRTLEILMLQSDAVISRDTLMVRLYGYETEVSEKCVEMNIMKLRKVIGTPEVCGCKIVTSYGLGYQMMAVGDTAQVAA